MLTGRIETVFGWPLHVGAEFNPRSLMNFPMQANGAEMLRLACCLATERGIRVCAPVHDALLIEAPLERDRRAVAALQACMREASRIVLGGRSSWAATPRWCAGRTATWTGGASHVGDGRTADCAGRGREACPGGSLASSPCKGGLLGCRPGLYPLVISWELEGGR